MIELEDYLVMPLVVISANNLLIQLREMQMSVDALEKERDFYYGKLRSIEIMCTDKEGEDEMGLLVGQIFEVLYATEDGFQVFAICGSEILFKIFFTYLR